MYTKWAKYTKCAKHFEYTTKQYNVLDGIAHYQAALIRINTRQDRVEYQPDLNECRKTLSALFKEADELNIPFWVQNIALSYAQDYKRYIDTYLSSYLRRYGIVSKWEGNDNVAC